MKKRTVGKVTIIGIISVVTFVFAEAYGLYRGTFGPPTLHLMNEAPSAISEVMVKGAKTRTFEQVRPGETVTMPMDSCEDSTETISFDTTIGHRQVGTIGYLGCGSALSVEVIVQPNYRVRVVYYKDGRLLEENNF